MTPAEPLFVPSARNRGWVHFCTPPTIVPEGLRNQWIVDGYLAGRGRPLFPKATPARPFRIQGLTLPPPPTPRTTPFPGMTGTSNVSRELSTVGGVLVPIFSAPEDYGTQCQGWGLNLEGGYI
eukprot:759069-Hanusia_phi.AAC.1